MQTESDRRPETKVTRNNSALELRAEFPDVDPEAIEATLAFMEVAAQRSLSEELLYGKFALSRGRFEILMFLKRQPNRTLAPSVLAQFAGVSRPTMTQFLDVLERDGLVRRKRDANDRRACLIALTSKGKKLINEILPEHFRWLTRFVKVLSPIERKQLRKLMSKLKVGMEGVV